MIRRSTQIDNVLMTNGSETNTSIIKCYLYPTQAPRQVALCISIRRTNDHALWLTSFGAYVICCYLYIFSLFIDHDH